MWLWLAFILSLLIQVGFYLIIFRNYAFFPIQKKTDNLAGSNDYEPGVSIVICAKNEAGHIGHNLDAIAKQNYSNFEILLVDDGSEDTTPLVLESFRKEFSKPDRRVIVLSISKDDSRGKKKALSLGIETASNEIILLTDADCKPSSSSWIKEMVHSLSKEKELVLGYGPYQKQKGSFLNKIIRYETLLTAIQYFSYALNKMPYMGVGRNLAYKRHLFESNRGFESHLSLKSGDDDLFVSQVANYKNTVICDHADSFVYSAPKKDLKSWIRQKRRHISTSAHYKKGPQAMLSIFYLSQIGFYLFGVALLIWGSNPEIAFTMILIRFFIYYRIVSKSARRLEEKDLILLAPLYEISVIFMQLYIFIANQISPPRHW